MLALSLGVLLAGDCSQVGEVDGVSQLALLFVLVYGELVRSEHDVNGLPRLCPPSPLEHGALFDDAVVLVAAELCDGRERVDCQTLRVLGDGDCDARWWRHDGESSGSHVFRLFFSLLHCKYERLSVCLSVGTVCSRHGVKGYAIDRSGV